MYVCVCNAVTDREIVERVRAGTVTLEAMRFELGVATCCGQCADCARELIDETLDALAAASMPGAVALRRPHDLLPSSRPPRRTECA